MQLHVVRGFDTIITADHLDSHPLERPRAQFPHGMIVFNDEDHWRQLFPYRHGVSFSVYLEAGCESSKAFLTPISYDRFVQRHKPTPNKPDANRTTDAGSGTGTGT
jgi:hypothetical protein